MKKIKTFEEACKLLKIDASLPDVSKIREKNRASAIAHYKLEIIAEALNYDSKTKTSWVPDWDNGEWKYWPWFWMDSSGFRFFDSGYDYDCTTVGSRLCYRTREISDYAGNTFIDIYRDLMVIPK